MNINTGLNPYNSNYVNNTDRVQMSKSQSLTGAVTDTLKEGEIFEGSVNSIDNGKVTIGLANGQTMTARLDSGVTLTEGQSIFFEVKSNDGALVQIRPVSLNALDANPTLLKALDMANIVANERTINMVNSMMQNSLSISPENIMAMNRAMINNPGVNPQTLVTMTKYDMPLTSDNVAMFENYASDKALLTNNFDKIADTLPELMAGDNVSTADVISLNNSIKEIFINQSIDSEEFILETNLNTNPQSSENTIADFSSNMNENNANISVTNQESGAVVDEAVKMQATVDEALITNESPNKDFKDSNIISAKETADIQNPVEVKDNTLGQNAGNDTIGSFASEKQIASFNSLINNMSDFPKSNPSIFNETGMLKTDADTNQLFKEVVDYLNDNPNIPKESLNELVKNPLYKGMLRNIISNSFALEPKDITKPGEISKLYEKVLKQTGALERIVSAFDGKAAESIKNQTNEIKQNINFMNSANEMYNFIQIPLKMYNQNTDSMLYVKQNKKSSYEAGEEITAFLHFDMEYLGSTDVFISLKETNVGCKWNLASEESMKLIEDNIDILIDRLADKGFSVSSEVSCGNPKADFVEDFLGAPPIDTSANKEGIVHRYSFDMRA